MRTLNKKDRMQYLSAPALNKINNVEYIEGLRSLSVNKSGSSHSMNFPSDKNLKNKRRKSFLNIFSLNGSSTNEKTELSFKVIDIDLRQKTWNSSFLSPHNDQTESCHFNSLSENETTKIKESISPMTQAHSVSRGPTDPDGSAGAPLTTKNLETSELIQSSRSSKARQKKFHRHFKQVDIEEKVLDYYSCALVGDILLQGHLYITENFFAFYSNVFGYVTKLLIPMVDVLKISKEKTAKIIPNAVGISTEDEKHVFGSLLSRDATYKFMLQVWRAAIFKTNSTAQSSSPSVLKTELASDEDSSASSGNEEPSSYISNLTSPASSDNLPKLLPNAKRKSILLTAMEAQSARRGWDLFKVKTILMVSLILLILLLGSAGYLFYRIAILENHFNELSISHSGSVLYEDMAKWQSSVHSRSANKISEFLNTNLNQIIKVRLSLEALSMLILPGNNNIEKPHSNSKWGSTIFRHSSEETKPKEN